LKLKIQKENIQEKEDEIVSFFLKHEQKEKTIQENINKIQEHFNFFMFENIRYIYDLEKFRDNNNLEGVLLRKEFLENKESLFKYCTKQILIVQDIRQKISYLNLIENTNNTYFEKNIDIRKQFIENKSNLQNAIENNTLENNEDTKNTLEKLGIYIKETFSSFCEFKETFNLYKEILEETKEDKNNLEIKIKIINILRNFINEVYKESDQNKKNGEKAIKITEEIISYLTIYLKELIELVTTNFENNYEENKEKINTILKLQREFKDINLFYHFIETLNQIDNSLTIQMDFAIKNAPKMT
jgi:hypothetical protein